MHVRECTCSCILGLIDNSPTFALLAEHRRQSGHRESVHGRFEATYEPDEFGPLHGHVLEKERFVDDIGV